MAVASCSRARRRTSVRTVWAAMFRAVRCNQPDTTARPASWTRVFGNGDKYALRHIFREMRVTHHPPRGEELDEIHVSAHQFGKCRVGAIFGVGAQQL